MSSAFESLEPVLDTNEIQGNILGGFNKDHQAVLPLHFANDAQSVAAVRSWLRSTVLPSITWLPEVVAFKRQRHIHLAAIGREPTDLRALWTAVAFSHPGLRKLTAQADAFEPIFRAGLPASSHRLGDPTQNGVPGHVSTWTIGGPDRIPDMLIVIAGDDADEVEDVVQRFLSDALSFGVQCPTFDVGHDLAFFSDPTHTFARGHEHFGFKDGVSQPGVRGRLSAHLTDFLTPRTMPPADPDSAQPEFSAPGRPLVCVGEFLLGYPRQLDNHGRRADAPWRLGPEPFAPDPTAIAPYWAKNGSFLVYRRLRQDVPAFNRFLIDEAARLQQFPDFAGIDAGQLGALLVGRWPSGAPVLRAPVLSPPRADDLPLGQASSANNAFGFMVPAVDPQDGFLPPIADPLGRVCPQAAHIRKVNPRELPTDQGPPTTSLVHRLLRRGIPYGRPLPFGATEDAGEERGLLFLSYMASIREQFEFLTSTWMDDVSKPTPQFPPSNSGFDMIVGQNNAAANRQRFCLIGPSDRSVSTIQEWVIPTGGGYFFAPSRSALRDILAAD